MAFEELDNRPQDENIETESQEPKKTKKKAGVIAAVAAAGVIAAAGGVFAFIKVTEKDPKEIVIQAFENIYTKDQVDPLEELFGLSGFAENASGADVERGVTLTLDSSSSAELDMFTGSGFKIEGLYDRTNKRSRANVGIVYKGMDLFHADAYYGEDTLMAAVPELSSKLFSLDLGEGLAKRLKDSPVLGPMLEENDIDIEGIGAYMEELADSVDAEAAGTETSDLEDIAKRFLDGWQAREKLKEAMTVEKAEKKTFVIDEQEVNLKGYQVQISKEFMMEFLRGSTDFFLNDEELKEIYLNQLQQSVRMTELMGGMTYGMSAEQMYEDAMADMTGDVEEMIDFLDQTLNDVDMTVYVDKKGRLASVSGTTVLTAESGVESDNIQVDFAVELKGGSYLTQNLTADVKLKNENAQVDVEVKKQGSYDGTQLTDDISLDIDAKSEEDYSIGIVYTDTYNSDGGDYHVGTSVTANGYLIADLSLTGVVSQLEKGVSAQVDIDELRVVIMNETGRVTLSGECYFRPLSEEIKTPEGEIFDVVAASEEEWEALGTEVFMKILEISSQLGMTD
ncbi:MAG: zinc ribbon domain-containing protein [Hungatella sp.]|nr:zinc ribbon domain-containing protein [Hungatella sp.]